MNFAKYGNKEKFPAGRTFGHGCVFGNHCKFGDGTTFADNCVFGNFCMFGDNVTFGMNCTFGANAKYDATCAFGSSCTFGKNTTFECDRHACDGRKFMQFDKQIGRMYPPVQFFRLRHGDIWVRMRGQFMSIQNFDRECTICDYYVQMTHDAKEFFNEVPQ